MSSHRSQAMLALGLFTGYLLFGCVQDWVFYSTFLIFNAASPIKQVLTCHLVKQLSIRKFLELRPSWETT